MPVTVTITRHPTGAVVASGGDDLAHRLLSHAGFTRHSGWHGIRHRLPTTTTSESRNEIVDDAVGLLTLARYEVRLAGDLAEGRTPLNRGMLHLADRVRQAENGLELADALEPLVHAERGMLIRAQEALEAAAEQVTDLDPEAVELHDRLGATSEQLFALHEELTGILPEAAAIAPGPARPWSQAASPAAERTGVRAAPVPEAPAPPGPGADRGARGR